MGGCGHIDMVKAPVAAPSVDVNKPDNEYGRTPLYWASSSGHTEVVKVLLAAPGIDVNKASYSGGTPLAAAKNKEIKVLLRAAGAGACGGIWCCFP